MRPLSPNHIQTFLQRFENFSDAELRSMEVNSATSISVSMAVQDSARAFDWITITLTFEGVSDAKLIDANKLSFVDMSAGISILHTQNSFAFCVGSYKDKESIKNATLFVISDTLKYKESEF